MKKSIISILFTAISCMMLANTQPCPIIPSRLDNIDSTFTNLVDSGLIPHAVTLVIHKGDTIHHKAYGWRDIDAKIPCQTSDIFRLASQTKPIIAVALMTLWEKGYFQLDEPIHKYLPEFANPRVLAQYNRTKGTYTTTPATSPITIRQLLTHTSGISKSGAHARIAERAGVPLSVTLEAHTLKDVVNKIATLPLAHNPGEQFTYSYNTEVIGRLIEVLSGKSIDIFLQEEIFTPLGMTDTHFYLHPEKAHRLVTLYTYPKGGPLQRSNHNTYQNYPTSGTRTYLSCAAGLCGTASDYARFCLMILNGGELEGKRILGRKTVEMMQRNNVGTLRGDIGFSLAWDYYPPEYLHKTPASLGTMRWGGMFGTDFIIDPTEQLIIITHINWSHNGTGIDTKTLMHNLVYQALK